MIATMSHLFSRMLVTRCAITVTNSCYLTVICHFIPHNSYGSRFCGRCNDEILLCRAYKHKNIVLQEDNYAPETPNCSLLYLAVRSIGVFVFLASASALFCLLLAAITPFVLVLGSFRPIIGPLNVKLPCCAAASTDIFPIPVAAH